MKRYRSVVRFKGPDGRAFEEVKTGMDRGAKRHRDWNMSNTNLRGERPECSRPTRRKIRCLVFNPKQESAVGHAARWYYYW